VGSVNGVWERVMIYGFKDTARQFATQPGCGSDGHEDAAKLKLQSSLGTMTYHGANVGGAGDVLPPGNSPGGSGVRY
jgi:hypothetical protein